MGFYPEKSLFNNSTSSKVEYDAMNDLYGVEMTLQNQAMTAQTNRLFTAQLPNTAVSVKMLEQQARDTLAQLQQNLSDELFAPSERLRTAEVESLKAELREKDMIIAFLEDQLAMQQAEQDLNNQALDANRDLYGNLLNDAYLLNDA